MMERYQLDAKVRENFGKSYARKLRQNNHVPAVVYSSEGENLVIEVEASELRKAIAASAGLMDLNVSGKKHPVLLKELQTDPVKGTYLHVDFYKVDMNKPIETTVPVVVVNEESRENDGGVINRLLWELKISCLPANIPETIELDVQDLKLGDTVLVKDVTAPEGVEILDDAEEVVLTVTEVKAVAEEAETDEAGEEEATETAEETSEEDEN
jgi:large subunit ribosomal protein L25